MQMDARIGSCDSEIAYSTPAFADNTCFLLSGGTAAKADCAGGRVLQYSSFNCSNEASFAAALNITCNGGDGTLFPAFSCRKVDRSRLMRIMVGTTPCNQLGQFDRSVAPEFGMDAVIGECNRVPDSTGRHYIAELQADGVASLKVWFNSSLTCAGPPNRILTSTLDGRCRTNSGTTGMVAMTAVPGTVIPRPPFTKSPTISRSSSIRTTTFLFVIVLISSLVLSLF